MTANYTVDGIEYNWQTGRPVISVTKFMNNEGEIDSLIINPRDDTVTIENSEGTVLANYVNGKFAPTDDGIGSVISNEVIYAQNFGHAFGLLDDIDQEKLSIYSSQNDINDQTISDLDPSTVVDGAYNYSLNRPIVMEDGTTAWIDPEGRIFQRGDRQVKMADGSIATLKEDGTIVNNPTNSLPPVKAWTLSDLNIPIESYPRDPEGFYIGRYPINQKDTNNFDYLKVTCYDYEPGLMQGGGIENIFKIKDMDKRVKTRRGVISLPIQPGISESNGVGWGENELSPIQLAGANVAGGAIDALTGRGVDVEGFRSAIESNLKVLNNIGEFEEIIKAYFAGQAVGADLIGRATGQAINKNVEVLFTGPQLRTFGYSYRFTPREPREAREIKEIIRFFKKSMAPKRSNSRIFLKSPNVWKLKYTFRNGDSHPFLNNIKICALTGFNVDYTPDGSYSTYDNEGGVGDGSMTSYQVSMSFKELTPIYNDDFWTDDEGQEGTGF